MKMIQHNKPCIGKEEIQAVIRVLKSNWLIAGPQVHAFEEHFKTYIGMPFAVAVNSGTAALHLSLLSLNIQPGDEVIIPTYTTADILNAIYYVQAVPVLVDNAKNSCVIDEAGIEKKITKRTKAIIVPHTFGFPADVVRIRKCKIPIIEDCAQAVGTTIQNKKVGSFGDLSIFSFYTTKLLATGQGGMVLTNNKNTNAFLRDVIDYNGRNRYAIRYNYPLTDIAASIGNVQLQKYHEFCKKRKHIVALYQEVLEKKHIFHLPQKTDSHVVPFRFVFQLPKGVTATKMEKLFKNKGIQIKQPIAPYELLHRLLHKDKTNFPHAESFTNSMMSLPLYPCLGKKEVQHICTALRTVL